MFKSYFLLSLTLHLLFCSDVTAFEDSDIIPIKIIGRPDTYSRRDHSRRTQDEPAVSYREESGRSTGGRLVDNKCMKCICYASTKCELKDCVNSGPESYFCGPFEAGWAYWSDGGKPTIPGGLSKDNKLAFEECLKDYNCSTRAVEGYMTKHQQDCNDDRQVDCYDFARMHKAGAYSCDAEWVENQVYWSRFTDCMDGKVRVTIPRNLKHRSDHVESASSRRKERPHRKPSTSVASGRIVDDKCLRCMCYANTKCEARGCVGASNICGPFQATWTYWADGGKPTVPGGLAVTHPHSFEECLKDYDCSARAVEGYMTKHQKDCDGNNVVDCYDFAKLHKAGAYACPATWLENQNYWTLLNECMDDRVTVSIPDGNKPLKPKAPPTNDRHQTAVDTVTSSQTAPLDDRCMRCLCYASTKCKANGCVNSGPESYFCGPFQASWTYWSDGGKPTVPGGLPADHKHAFEECLKDYKCASKAVKGYMNKHHQDCDNNGQENCYDYARIHKAGAYSCGASWVEGQTYWSQFLDCMDGKVQVSVPGEASVSTNNNRRKNTPQINVWHPPPPAGPYEAPPTARPISNARLPPFVPDTPKRRPVEDDFVVPRRKNNNRRRPSPLEQRAKPFDVRINVIDDKCLQCLCYASSECEALGCHNAGPDKYFCGAFQASWAYWKEAGSHTVPGGLDVTHKHAFEECLKDYECSVQTVQGYMRKFKTDCDNDHVINCYDYAKIHKVGPYTCNVTSLESTEYWNRLNDCMDGYVTFE